MPLVAALGLAAGPALAQEETPNADLSQGADLLTEGTKLILRGLLSELEPMAEGWDNFIDQLGDLALYYPPEVLPNGDIIIRRRVPLDPDAEPVPQPDSDGATDL